MKHKLISAIAMLAVASTVITQFAAPAGAEPTERDKVIVVLDASGSMWGQIKGEPKIAIAKSVVKSLVEDWNPDVDLGLSVYGHRRKADCADIDLLVPPAPLDKPSFLKAVEGLSAKGKTPLTEAVSRAADALRYTEDRATVVLVSDGIETCDRDPCAVAKALEDQGVDFTAHVIGFDVSKEQEIAQLKCIAENTGGKFLGASDADSLKKSLAEAVNEVAKVESGVELVAVYEPGGEPVDGVSWTVQTVGDGGTTVKYGGGATPRYRLSPGRYAATAKKTKGSASATTEFEVVEGAANRVEVVIAQEVPVTLVAVTEPGGEPLEEVSWQLHPADKDSQLAKTFKYRYGGGATPVYTVPPGKFLAKVQSQAGKAKAEQEIEVTLDGEHRFEILLAEEGVLQLHAVHEAGGESLERVAWEVRTIETDPLKQPKLLSYGGGAKPQYKLLPGRYQAKAKSLGGKATAEKEVEVRPGVLNTEEVVLPKEGVLKLAAVTEAGSAPLEDISWEVRTIESDPLRKPELVTYGGGNTPDYQLLPGRYQVTAKSKSGMAEVKQDVEVLAGKVNDIQVPFPQEGLLKLEVVSAEGGAPLNRASWEVRTIEADPLRKPTLVKYGGGATPEYRMLPGRYTAIVRIPGSKETAEMEVEVEPGERVVKQLVLTAEE
ncbi:MAG: VWA domain-containing protein [Bdellovibrionales bacterium]|nr:VWA domain-containing protein [Bdellovibrionales bacterium]